MTVAAASHLVGDEQAGDSWKLDVSSGSSVAAATPFADTTLLAYTHPLLAATPPAPVFPIHIDGFAKTSATGTLTGFSDASGTASTSATFFTSGSSTIVGSALQLTAATASQAGLAVATTPIPSGLGISVRFTYVSSGGTGADGISFFLLNGDELGSTLTSTSVTAGGYGGGLGYSDDGKSGITDGFLGIGFDTYGNYSTVDHAPQTAAPGVTAPRPNYIGVRGSGTGTLGYAYLAGAAYTPGIDGTRTVQVNLTPLSSGTGEQLTIYVEPSGSSTFGTVLSTTLTQTLPSSLYFGFGASTGGSTDTHQIGLISVTVPTEIMLSQATVKDTTTGVTNPTLAPGDSFTYTYTVTNAGPSGDAEITVTDLLPADVVNGGWALTDDRGSSSGTGSIIPVNLAAGDVGTIVVHGTINPNASSGNADHLVSVSAGTAYSIGDPNASTSVTLQIGHGQSVSLIGANETLSTTDAAPVQPFTQAQVVDTFTTAAGTAPTDTLTVTINRTYGALGGSGGTYNSNTGVFTATGTPAVLGSTLAALTFTPDAHITAPGTVSDVNAVVTVQDTSSGNTTGVNGTSSATQTTTLAVTAAHDAPVLAGGVADQPVADTGSIAPLAGVSVADPDDVGLTASVTIDGGATGAGSTGQFTAASAAGWSVATVGNDLVYSESFGAAGSNAAAAQAAIEALVFQPAAHTLPPGGTLTTPFSVVVADTATPSLSSTATSSVTVTAVADQVTLGGLPLINPAINDTQTIAPFGQLTIQDPDHTGGTVTVTIADGVAEGDFTPASAVGWTRTVIGTAITYTRDFAAANDIGSVVQAAVNALTYKPVVGAVAPGTFATDLISLSLGIAQPAQTVQTSTTVTATGSEHPYPLLSAVAITDPSQVITVSARLVAGTTGRYSQLGIGTVSADGLTYQVTGTAAAVTTALHEVFFTPTVGSSIPDQYTATVTGGASNVELIDGSAGNNLLVAPTGGATVMAGTGSNTVIGGSGTDQLDGGGGPTLFLAGAGDATIHAGAGSATVFGGGGNVAFVNQAASSLFVAGSGAATAYGGTGALRAFGGTGNAVLFGGSAGGNVLVAGQGTSSVVGAATGDTLYASQTGNAVIAAGLGNETLFGGGSTGDNLFFGNSGADSIVAGNGSDTVVGGSGDETIYGGHAGGMKVFGGSGSETVVGAGGADTYVASAGSMLVYGGNGASDYIVRNGFAGGNLTIVNFKPGVDSLGLFGYGSDAASNAFKAAQPIVGGSRLTLSDGTHITIYGAPLQVGGSFASM